MNLKTIPLALNDCHKISVRRHIFRVCLSVLLFAGINASGQITNTAERGPMAGVEISGSQNQLLYAPSYDECFRSAKSVVTRKDIYHDGWIDLNKNRSEERR